MMKRNTPFSRVFLLILSTAFIILAGCASRQDGSDNVRASSGGKRETIREFLQPTADGTALYGDDTISVDASHTDEGYVMVRYQGDSDLAKLQITVPNETVYTYTLSVGSYEAFPLSGGDGSYHLDILEHAYDNMYALAFSQDISVSLTNEFTPFLYPNQYVWFTPDSEAVQLGMDLSEESSDDLDYVDQVYHYVIENISYDTQAAEHIPTDYIPDIDVTLSTGKGICFDYASLMSAMLRSQGIPTRLEVGYSGTSYHAWISVYLKESGWIDNIIEFDGSSWSLMDPTLAANNSEQAVKKYIGDGSNYTVKYLY